MKHYAIKRADGGVSFMHFQNDEADPSKFLAGWTATAKPEELPVVAFEEVKFSDLPAGCKPGVEEDRTFRDCVGHDCKVDMGRAREHWRNRMREARQPLLDELDRQYSRAVGQNKRNDADAVEAKRQALRDVTGDSRIDAAKTTSDLINVWPEALEKPGAR